MRAVSSFAGRPKCCPGRMATPVATKVGAANLAPDDIYVACERSLRHLNTDYIDLYQIHWPNHDVPLADSLGALERLKEQGKIRAIGVCNFGPLDLDDLLDIGRTETDQMPYSMLWRPIEHEIQPKCVENGIGIICYSPLSQGLLTGRYATADDVPDGLARSRHFADDRPHSAHGEEGCEEELFEAIDRVRKIAGELGRTMANVALAWVRQQPGVTSLLVGARNTHELHLNLAGVGLLLPEDVLGQLADATESVRSYLGTNPDMWQTPSRMR